MRYLTWCIVAALLSTSALAETKKFKIATLDGKKIKSVDFVLFDKSKGQKSSSKKSPKPGAIPGDDDIVESPIEVPDDQCQFDLVIEKQSGEIVELPQIDVCAIDKLVVE